MSDPTPPTSARSAKQIFVEAVELPADQRAAFLEAHCGDDPALRGQVEALLAADERAGHFLAGPTSDPDRVNVALVGPQATPERIGPYRILEELGEGGFGTVYLAEQEHPVRRTVALKIIKLGMDTRRVIARFEAERQALAMMDHPNIARVFDAGATDTGRPYFVMELVKGVPVTQYCDENKLSPRQRLELFIPICQAVQHAHQKGVIHRDIKPSNVLVTIHDGKPVPKVIDFGIAKAISQRLTEKTIFTEFRQMIGTPEYMSPEQAEISGLDIDTRTDVYSLGVLLYELLTGLTPFDSRELRSRAYAEMQRVIREVEPPAPSTRVSTNENLPSIAAQRGIEPRKLTSMVRGELDWIVMKCLEKDRTRRYDSPSALASDVAHYLADEPVAASSPSRIYRVRKFVRRNKLALSVVATVFVALVAGLTAASVGLIRARRAEALAQQRLEDMQAEMRRTSLMNDLLNGILLNADPHRTELRDPKFSEVLQQAARRIDVLQLSAEADMVATVRATLGRIFIGLGRYDEALRQLQIALALRQKLPDYPNQPDTADILNLTGTCQAELGQLDAAETSYREALSLRQKLFGESSTQANESLGNLASVLFQQGKLDQAEDAYRRALALFREGKIKPTEADAVLLGLAMVLQNRAKTSEAEALLREAVALNDQHRRRDDPTRITALNNLATFLARQRRFDEAEQHQSEALRIAQLSLPPDHPDTLMTLLGLAGIRWERGDLPGAQDLYRQALQICRTGMGDAHPETARAAALLAGTLNRPDQQSEAESLFRQAIPILRRLPAYHRLLRTVLLNFCGVLFAKGDWAEAEVVAREALQLSVDQLGPDSAETASAQARLAYTLLKRDDKLDEAVTLSRAALATRQKLFPADSWNVQITRSMLGEAFMRQGRLEEAAGLISESYEIIERAADAPPQTKGDSRERLARLYELQGKPDEARRLRESPNTQPATGPR
jgi:serine/threonine protein kinase/tetratricopeptide (TPR) repeat protein